MTTKPKKPRKLKSPNLLVLKPKNTRGRNAEFCNLHGWMGGESQADPQKPKNECIVCRHLGPDNKLPRKGTMFQIHNKQFVEHQMQFILASLQDLYVLVDEQMLKPQSRDMSAVFAHCQDIKERKQALTALMEASK